MKKKIKKENYWVPLFKNMYDCCYCNSKDCACPCGRKPSKSNKKERELERYITMSDFSPVCDHYVKDKLEYKLIVTRPRIDPTNPHQKNNGYFIEKEVEMPRMWLETLRDLTETKWPNQLNAVIWEILEVK